ncbi:MAG: hypothetical protein O7C75_14770 [Verrucomicrobia bacterium]|nr:hypothetical protein [Verrucomicrobiota bacterium]
MQKTSEGVVKGVVTGIIKAPFSVISGLGKSIFPSSKLTDTDKSLMAEAAIKLLNSGEKADQKKWENPESGINGTAMIEFISIDSGGTCKTIKVRLYKKGRKIDEGSAKVCRQPGEFWVLVEIM